MFLSRPHFQAGEPLLTAASSQTLAWQSSGHGTLRAGSGSVQLKAKPTHSLAPAAIVGPEDSAAAWAQGSFQADAGRVPGSPRGQGRGLRAPRAAAPAKSPAEETDGAGPGSCMDPPGPEASPAQSQPGPREREGRMPGRDQKLASPSHLLESGRHSLTSARALSTSGVGSALPLPQPLPRGTLGGFG